MQLVYQVLDRVSLVYGIKNLPINMSNQCCLMRIVLLGPHCRIRLRIGRDGHLDQSEAYHISQRIR